MNFLEQLTYNLERGEHYQDAEIFDLRVPDVRIIAFICHNSAQPRKTTNGGERVLQSGT